MAESRLTALPEELIALVGLHCDATSALNLSQANRRCRSACYNATTFRQILVDSQANLWSKNLLSVDAIAARASGDVSIWARYAVADEKAWTLSQQEEEPSLESPEAFLSWLPELLIMNHPILLQPFWTRPLHNPMAMSAKQLQCLALVVLTGKESLVELARSVPTLINYDESWTGWSWAFCCCALNLRNQLHRRQAAWPYNAAALLPYVPLPDPASFLGRNPTAQLPLPFSRSDNARNEPIDWHLSRGKTLTDVVETIVDTEWCGYYIHGYDAAGDPPMIDIRFTRTSEGSRVKMDSQGMRVVTDTIGIQARQCRDGIASFDITGTFFLLDGVCTFEGRKEYPRFNWDWELRLTPFGLIGFWGKVDMDFERHGCVWLWPAGA